MNTKNKINIFIVDDNKVFASALEADIETTFNNRFAKIYVFETGEKCMRRFMQVMPELVILDYYLNGNDPNAADGIKVLDWIKKQNNETNVIMLTSDDHIDVALKSLKHGASDYVVKSETQFEKINYSLSNFFKMRKAKREARKYKILSIGLFLCIAFLAGKAILNQLYDHLLFK